MTKKSRSGKEEEKHPHKLQTIRRCEKDLKVKTSSGKVKKNQSTLVRCGRSLNAEEVYRKSLYCCSFEVNQSIHKPKEKWDAFVVRAINLGDFFSLSSSKMKLELQQVTYRGGNDLPVFGGCGVLGSQIVFVSGLTQNHSGRSLSGCCSSREVYVFDTKHPEKGIVKMDGTLNLGKYRPLTVQVAGKLYSLCNYEFSYCPPDSFEVFDPKERTWSLLPDFPSNYGHFMSYAIVATKFFVSNAKVPVCCFDVADESNKQQWRRVPSMCGGGPFPFWGQALVLDLPEHHNNKKIMFTSHSKTTKLDRITVYAMSLDENQETITLIREMQPPELPELPGEPAGYHFLHLGGNNVCIVIPNDPPNEFYKHGSMKMRCDAIPFQFEFDKENCFTVQFLPPRILEYHTNPSCSPKLSPNFGFFVI